MVIASMFRVVLISILATQFQCIQGSAEESNLRGSVVVANAENGGSIVLRVPPHQSVEPKDRNFRFLGSWRYHPDEEHWIQFSPEASERVTYRLPTSESRILFSFDVETPALYAVCWLEAGSRHVALVPTGDIMCNDLAIGDPPEGMVVACIPSADRATAAFVPDPLGWCD